MGYCTKIHPCRYCGGTNATFNYTEVTRYSSKSIEMINIYLACTCGNRDRYMHETMDDAVASWNADNPKPDFDCEKGIL